MKRILMCFLLLIMCVSIFAVKYEEGKTLDVYPDTMISGNRFAIQFDPVAKTVVLADFGSANTLMVRGDKTGSSEVSIGPNGAIPYDLMVQLFESNSELYLMLTTGKTSLAAAKILDIDGHDFSVKLNKSVSAEFFVGGEGPSGGIVFYDKGEYSDGWRYLEVAPADLRVVTGTPSVDKSDPWYDFSESTVSLVQPRWTAWCWWNRLR